MSPRRAGALCLLAAAYTGLNACLPLQIDDPAYISYARQIAAHPLDPYGFVIQWFGVPQPANEVLAPPVLPYSIAPAVWLFGDRPVLWKLALLPWSLLLAFAAHALLARFAPGLELKLTAFLMFSPALLPSLNLMLDVPALALSLSAIYQFLRACDASSPARSVLAGLTAAVAMQTKYTGILAVVAIVIAAVVYRAPRLGGLAVTIAALGFAGWELCVAKAYGASHFLIALETSQMTIAEHASLLPVFFSQLGGLAAALVVFGLAATNASGRALLTAGAATALAYAAITLLDARYIGMVRPAARLFGPAAGATWKFQLVEIVFDAIAGAAVLILWRAWRLFRSEASATGSSDTHFLFAWLAAEGIGYLFLTPFPAARRVLGVFVVLTFLFGRLASRTCATPARRRLIDAIVAIGVVLGLAYFALDWLGARAYQRGAERAAEFVRENGGRRMWYTGRWGFCYYAERCGMMPVVPRYEAAASYIELPAPSRLQSGDWLVIARDGTERAGLDLATAPAPAQVQIAVEDAIPLRVVPCFFWGRTPLEHHEGPRLTVFIYRIEGNCELDCVPIAEPAP